MIIKDDGEKYLVYSEDDGGYYWQSGDKTSQLFKTREEAEEAERRGELKWEE